MTFLYNRINYSISIEISMFCFLSSPTWFLSHQWNKRIWTRASRCMLGFDLILLGAPQIPQDDWVATEVVKCDLSWKIRCWSWTHCIGSRCPPMYPYHATHRPQVSPDPKLGKNDHLLELPFHLIPSSVKKKKLPPLSAVLKLEGWWFSKTFDINVSCM